MRAENVVISALIGHRRRLYAPAVANKNWRYVCFTNNRHVKSPGWEIVRVDKEIVSDCRDAKRFKMRAREFVEAKRFIWIDAHCRLVADPDDLWPINGDIKLVRHWRKPNCIYHEARACIRKNKDSSDLIARQVDQYRKRHPPRSGLYYGGFVAYESGEATSRFFEKWWMLTQAGSSRDQISLPVAIRESGVEVDVIATGDRGSVFHIRSH